MVKRYAVIENGVVENIALAYEPIAANWIEVVDGVVIGSVYTNGVFYPPRDDGAADRVRAERNVLLSASDWTQVADAPVDQQAWASYRQALRDIPEQPGFPHDIIWPVAPV